MSADAWQPHNVPGNQVCADVKDTGNKKLPLVAHQIVPSDMVNKNTLSKMG